MKHSQISKYVTLSLLSAIIVILQLISGYLKIGPVSITLVLVPVVVGAAFYGKAAGAFLGGVFGAIVFIGCVNGTDLGGNILFVANPYYCFFVCMLKGCASGFCAAAVYGFVQKWLVKKQRSNIAAVVCAAIVAPIVNTGLFCLCMAVLYRSTLIAWAGGQNAFIYMITGLAGINFLVEMAINLVCSPAITTIIKAVKKIR